MLNSVIDDGVSMTKTLTEYILSNQFRKIVKCSFGRGRYFR